MTAVAQLILPADMVRSEEQQRHAGREGLERVLRKQRYGRQHRWGWENDGEVDTEIQSAGAESAVADLLGRPWVISEQPDSDGDVGPGVQVRWTRHADGHLLLHPEDADDHVFFLVTGRMWRYRVVGWIEGVEGKLPEYWGVRAGIPRPCFWVPQRALLTCDPELPPWP